MIVVFNRRQVEVDQIGGDIEEPVVYNAWYIDTDEKLTDDEMDELAYKYADTLSQALIELWADMAYDLYNDK